MPRRSKAPPASAFTGSGWNPDIVFATLADPVRRRILLALADGKGRTSGQLSTVCHRRPDAVLKHLIVMRHAGWVTMTTDPADERRHLYALAPTVPLETTETGRRFNFGCCIVPAG
jgi:DNA-binding transcriptional ArsR family regulator